MPPDVGSEVVFAEDDDAEFVAGVVTAWVEVFTSRTIDVRDPSSR